MRLQQNKRLEHGEHNNEACEFANWLLDTGHGCNLSPDETIFLPQHMQCHNPALLIDFVYSRIGANSNSPPPKYFLNRVILAAHNNDVLSWMSTDKRVYYSADNVVMEQGADGVSADENPFPVKFLHTLNASGLPPGELSLKIGCPLIQLWNLAPAQGLCNGTRMVLLCMSNRVLEVRLIGGDHNCEVAFIPQVLLTPLGSTVDFAFQLKRCQFPVRLAFAITINKVQGQSAKYVGFDLRIPVFAHGQLYVALSQATSGQWIKVLLSDKATQFATPNVVYHEILVDW